MSNGGVVIYFSLLIGNISHSLKEECAFRIEHPLVQERSLNAEKNTHTKGRLPGQAMILFNCAPFENGNFS